MEQTLFPTIVGQDAPKRQLEFYIKNYDATGYCPHLMFTAPRGCGKTMLAKALAKNLKLDGRAKKFYEMN